MVFNTVLAVGGIFLCTGVSVYSNSCICTTEYNCSFADLPKSFDGFRVLQVSDLHNKRFGLKQQYLLKKIRAAKPDIIVITGDVIHDKTEIEQIERRLNKVRPFLSGAVDIAPVYYATGNHEIETGHAQYIWQEVEKCGVKVLVNDSVNLERNNESISLIGAADPFFYGKRRAYKPFSDELKKLCEAEKGSFKMLLSHRPELINVYSECGVQLVLTGHAHGGQIRIPFTPQGLYAPDQGVLPKYTQGVHNQKETKMVISRGLGNSGFPQRLFDRPELVVVTLHCQK